MVDYPLFAGNLQHPSSKFASRYGHLKTILERCKNHTPTTSMCNHPHAPSHTKLPLQPRIGRSWAGEGWVAAPAGGLKTACSGRGILEDGVVTFGDRVGGIAAPCQHLPESCRRLGTKPPPSYSRHKARDRTVGPGEVRRSIGMRSLPASPSTR
jgi:hypothetical protein